MAKRGSKKPTSGAVKRTSELSSTKASDSAVTTSSSSPETNGISKEEEQLFKDFYNDALTQYLHAKESNGALTSSSGYPATPKKCCLIKWFFKTLFKILVVSCLVYAIKLYILYQVKYYSLYYMLPPISYPLNKVKNYLITFFTIFITKCLPTNVSNAIIDKIGDAGSVGFEKNVIKNAVSIDMCSGNTLLLIIKLVQLQFYSILPTSVVEFFEYLINLIKMGLHNMHERIIIGISDIWVSLHPESHQYMVTHFGCCMKYLSGFTKHSCECVKKTFF